MHCIILTTIFGCYTFFLYLAHSIIMYQFACRVLQIACVPQDEVWDQKN